MHIKATHCINCSANTQDHYKRSSPTLEARKSVLLLAARLKVAFEDLGVDIVEHPSRISKLAHIHCVLVDFKCIVDVWGALDEISISHGKESEFRRDKL